MTAELLRELTTLFNQRRPIPVERYFTEDFRLDDAGAGVVRTGHSGARAMFDDMLSIAPNFHLEMLDAIESNDRVAVRWRVTGARAAGPFDVAMMAMYRFSQGRIAEDWDVWNSNPWQDR
jgi:predicted SnoaL-like aldol condensation-catalyzing enzyme